MFATPVIYPASYVNAHYRWVMDCNPLAAIIETIRYACLGGGAPEPLQLAVSAIVLIVLLFLGITIFTRAERNFIDTV
jgi:lipopolysaccharide transport system permease protein